MSSVWCAGTVFSSSYAAAVGPPSHAALMFDTTHAAAVVNTIARLWFLLLSSSSSSFSEALCCFDDFFFAAVVVVVGGGGVLLFVVVGRDHHPLTFRFVVGTKTIDDDDDVVVVVVARCHIPIIAFLNGASFSSFRFFPIEEEEEEILQSYSHRAYIYICVVVVYVEFAFLFSTAPPPPPPSCARATTTKWSSKWSSSKSHQIVMAKHHPDLIMCRKMPGIAIGRLCEKCDGKCVVCDSYVRPATLVRVCDECNYGSNQGRCVICNAVGVSDAYYCQGCVMQEKDRDGCPKIINLGSAKTDLFYHKKAAGEITGSGGRTY